MTLSIQPLEWFWLKYIIVLERPSQSLQINPIENHWQDLKADVQKGSLSNLTAIEQIFKEK